MERTQKWIKKGFIFKNDASKEWSRTHAQTPTVELIDGNIFRVWYSTRDNMHRSTTTYFECEADNPANIVYTHSAQVLGLGNLGCFDDCGAMPACIINNNSRTYFYYLGWNVRNTVSYHLSIGLAVRDNSSEKPSFYKFAEGPIIDRTSVDPYMCTSCYVMCEDVWKMWYTSATKWEIVDGKPEPFYLIKYAVSDDGINWKREGVISINYKSEYEAIGRPSVLFEDGIYKMWYTYRGIHDYRSAGDTSYRIGYAESKDGRCFERKDELAGIDVSENGWDSEMVAYPYVMKYKGRKYMFYNGNGFGQSGIGYAVMGE